MEPHLEQQHKEIEAFDKFVTTNKEEILESYKETMDIDDVPDWFQDDEYQRSKGDL